MIASKRLNELLVEFKLKNKDLATKLDIDPSMITKWLKDEEKIPHARVSQIVEMFELNQDDADLLLGNHPLEIYYRTRNHREFEKYDVSAELRERTDFIYEAFVRDYMVESKFDFDSIRGEFKALNIASDEAFKSGAAVLRRHFFIPPDVPISKNFVSDYIIEPLGINCYYMSFKSIGIDFSNGNEEDKKAAILFSRGERFGILIDADRNVSSAFFDLLHEILHVLIGKTFPRNGILEKFIDRTVGELIYPENYLKKILLNGRSEGKIGKSSEEIINIVIDKYYQDRTWSPIGLAKALVDYKMLGDETKIYTELTSEFYDFYKSHTKTMSELGEIKVNHSSFEEHKNLFENVIYKDPRKYPVYMRLRSKLMDGAIDPKTYAKLFSLKLSEVKVLKSLWTENDIVGELESWSLKE